MELFFLFLFSLSVFGFLLLFNKPFLPPSILLPHRLFYFFCGLVCFLKNPFFLTWRTSGSAVYYHTMLLFSIPLPLFFLFSSFSIPPSIFKARTKIYNALLREFVMEWEFECTFYSTLYMISLMYQSPNFGLWYKLQEDSMRRDEKRRDEMRCHNAIDVDGGRKRFSYLQKILG